MPKVDASILRAMPKVETHCHLDGSLRVSTIHELALELGVKMPADDPETLRRHVTVLKPCRSLTEVLRAFDALYPLLRHPKAVERAAYELCEDSAKENIRHVEVRLAPVLQAHKTFPEARVLEAVLRGLRLGRERFGITSGVIVCLLRGHTRDENRRAMRALVDAYRPDNGLREPGVVGMDLAGDENGHPPAEYEDFFEQARRIGIPATCHAGETPGAANTWAALRLGVRRIGHGLRILEDKALTEAVAARKIAVEVSLTSNLRTRCVAEPAAHPARALMKAGVPINFNTDDRGLFGITLSGELLTAVEAGFTVDEVVRISVDAVDHLFLPEADRTSLKAAIERETAALAAGTAGGTQ